MSNSPTVSLASLLCSLLNNVQAIWCLLSAEKFCQPWMSRTASNKFQPQLISPCPQSLRLGAPRFPDILTNTKGDKQSLVTKFCPLFKTECELGNLRLEPRAKPFIATAELCSHLVWSPPQGLNSHPLSTDQEDSSWSHLDSSLFRNESRTESWQSYR